MKYLYPLNDSIGVDPKHQSELSQKVFHSYNLINKR
jgi:hypothetical protein